MNRKYITYSGIEFLPLNFSEKDVNIMDIAHSLSRICRFNGHLNNFYSVSQHCICVSEYLKAKKFSKKVQLCGLLHDASEAYLCDLPKPIKKVLLDYEKLEKYYQKIIIQHFNLYSVWCQYYERIKEADLYAIKKEIEMDNDGNCINDCNNDLFKRNELEYFNYFEILSK